MKGQTLDASTREALGSLIQLAGALGVGAILATGLLPRRGSREHDVGLTVFETFAVTAILVIAGVSALSSVEFLRSDEIVTDSQFNQAATPLVLSVVLLVLLTAVARFSSLPGGISMHFPTVGATVFVAAAAGIYISVVPQQPETIAPASGAILIVGAVLAWFFRRMESWSVSGREASVRRRIVSLSAEGYRPVEVSLLVGVPVSPEGPEHLRCTGWSKKGRLFIDDAGCRSLQQDVRNRWNDLLLTGRAQAPLADRILTKLVLRSRILTRSPRLELVLEIYKQGQSEPKAQTLRADERGLFDLTELGIVHRVMATVA